MPSKTKLPLFKFVNCTPFTRVAPVPLKLNIVFPTPEYKLELAESKLTKYKEELEEIVQERTRDLLVEKEKAESADKLKTSFLATMS